MQFVLHFSSKKAKIDYPSMNIYYAHKIRTHFFNPLWCCRWWESALKMEFAIFEIFLQTPKLKTQFSSWTPCISNKFSSHDFSMTWWKSKSLFNCQSADCYHFLSSYLDWQDFWKISRASLLQNTPPWPTFLKERKLLRHTEYESTHRDQISFCTKE